VHVLLWFWSCMHNRVDMNCEVILCSYVIMILLLCCHANVLAKIE